jgi:hypothetical protein
VAAGGQPVLLDEGPRSQERLLEVLERLLESEEDNGRTYVLVLTPTAAEDDALVALMQLVVGAGVLASGRGFGGRVLLSEGGGFGAEEGV